MLNENSTKSSKTKTITKNSTSKKGAKKTAATTTSKKSTGKKTVAKKPKSISQDEKRTMIAMRAYFKWESAGYPDGDDYRHWIEAEQEVADILAR